MYKLSQRICRGCGSPFQPVAVGQKYCSAVCKKKSKRKLKERICEECGSLYMPVNAGQKYCCDQCRITHESKNKHKPKKTVSKVVCLNCGKEFMQNTVRQKYCCRQCQYKYNHAHKSENRPKKPKPNHNKLTQTGKIFVNLWIRLKLSNGLTASNKHPYSIKTCAKLMNVSDREIKAALKEYDDAITNGREQEFYNVKTEG